MTATTATFATALAAFVTNCQEMVNANNARVCPNVTPDTLSIDTGGRKYVRIVKTPEGGHSRSVYCFINRETGDVLKADGWKRPAKHARGTIYGDASGYGVTPYGGQYR